MKKGLLINLAILFFYTTYAQVGINTTNPQATLHVEGTIKVTNTAHAGETDEAVNATMVLGVDNEGNVVQLTLDDNLYIEGNKIKYVNRKQGIGTLPEFSGSRGNNVSLIIWPGGTNGGRSVIKIEHNSGDFEITGFDVSSLGGPAAADGVSVWLFPVDGDLTLKRESNLSNQENRILANGDVEILQYGMVQIMYDGTLERWIVMTKDDDDDQD